MELDTSNGTLRARTINGAALRSTESSSHLKPVEAPSSTTSAVSSARSTPPPEDAPPSVLSIKAARQDRRRLFPTVDYQNRVSHFDVDSSHRDFRGFFTLFWVGLVIMVITAGLKNLKDTRSVLRTSIFSLFTTSLEELALAEAGMCASTFICVPIQQAVQAGTVKWSKGGWIMQHCVQAVWLGVWVYLPFYLQWQWTHQVFFTLHAMTLLMKIHSYSFYCGHLSTTQQRLRALDGNDPENESQADTELREVLAYELTSPNGQVTYPSNLTYSNFADYIICPTLCYELSYPRTPKIRWRKVAEKVAGLFGCIFLLTVISEEFINPVMTEAAQRLTPPPAQASTTLLILLETISLLLFPFTITFLLVFLVIFEYVLGAFAEISCFADRHFYADWWNSTTWLEFSRMWNIPVHRFLQRHVYSASRSHVSRPLATLVTFLISAAAHELVMFCLTKKLRGYGFVCQMLQLPIVVVQQTRWVSEQRVLNNVLFWCSMIWGLSMICALYVLV